MGQGGNGGPVSYETNAQVKSLTTQAHPSTLFPPPPSLSLDPKLSFRLPAGRSGSAWLWGSERQQPELRGKPEEVCM